MHLKTNPVADNNHLLKQGFSWQMSDETFHNRKQSS